MNLDTDSRLRFPHLNGAMVSLADYSQVISHNLSHGSYRRGEPFVPAPKPIIESAPAPKKVTPVGKKAGVSGFNSAPTNMTVPKRRHKIIAESLVMKVVEMLVSGGKDHTEIASLTGLSRGDVSRIKMKSTQAAINCWAKVSGGKN